MGSEQQFCLRWNNFQSSLLTTLPQLLDGDDLTDVTLSAGGRSLRAHRVVLSACSQYFKELFREMQPYQHPVIVLPQTSFTDVCALVSFMYSGEVNIYQDQLPGLLAAASALHIRGLAEVPQANGSSGSKNSSETSQREKEREVSSTPLPLPLTTTSSSNTSLTTTPTSTPHSAKRAKISPSLRPSSPLDQRNRRSSEIPPSLKVEETDDYEEEEGDEGEEVKDGDSSYVRAEDLDHHMDCSADISPPVLSEPLALSTHAEPSFGHSTSDDSRGSAASSNNATDIVERLQQQVQHRGSRESVYCPLCQRYISQRRNLKNHLLRCMHSNAHKIPQALTSDLEPLSSPPLLPPPPPPPPLLGSKAPVITVQDLQTSHPQLEVTNNLVAQGSRSKSPVTFGEHAERFGEHGGAQEGESWGEFVNASFVLAVDSEAQGCE